MKKIKQILLTLCFVFGLTMAVKAQAFAGTLSLSVERCCLGGGFIVEPIEVEFTSGESYADVLERVLKDKGLTYAKTGGGASFYLAGIDGVDCGTANIPQSVKTVLSGMGLTLGTNKTSGLYERAYTDYSGWMYSVNDSFPNVGMGALSAQNGDAVRVMFEICFGAELTGELTTSYEGLQAQKFYNTVDKSSLMSIMGAANKDRTRWASVSGFSTEYNNALSVMAAMSADEADALAVSDAVGGLKAIQQKLPAEPTAISMNQTNLSLSVGGGTASLSYTILPADAITTVTWSCDNTSVAAVSNGVVTPKSVGSTTIWAQTSNGLKASCSVTVSEKPAEVTDVILSKSELFFNLGGASSTLSYTLYPLGASSSVTWSSDNPSVASVSTNGVVTPVSIGETDIRITTGNGYKDVCHVYVTQEITGITIPSNLTISMDDQPTALNYTLTPQGAQADLSWTSNKPSVATVDQKGVVTPVAAGTANIQVKADNGLKASCLVTVTSSFKSEFTLGKPVVSAEAVAYNSVKITWEEYKYAQSYIVYRRVVGSGTWTQLAEVTNFSYVDKTAVLGTSYYYTVKAATKKWGSVIYSDNTTNVNVKTSLDKAVFTKLQSASYNSTTLAWDPVEGASGYIIYRASSLGGTYAKTGSVEEDVLTYTDKSNLTTGKTYYYKIQAYRLVNGTQIYGSLSTVKSAKPLLTKPTLKAAAGSKKATLKWNKISGSNGYQIVYSSAKDGTYKTVKNVSSASTTAYTQKKLQKGKTYYYKIRAYRTVNNKKIYGSYSAVKSVKVK